MVAYPVLLSLRMFITRKKYLQQRRLFQKSEVASESIDATTFSVKVAEVMTAAAAETVSAAATAASESVEATTVSA